MSVAKVLSGEWNYHIERGKSPDCLRQLPDKCVNLTCFSPPYEKARLYLENGEDLGIALDTDAWVAWMFDIIKECYRVTKGLVVCVCEGQTENYRYSGGPVLLWADLIRAGFNTRKAPIYHRVGIPGSGGPDWVRNDYEFCLCVTPPGKLLWSDNTACGHPPKWAPGGEMSHRLSNGTRRNAWGANDSTSRPNRKGKREKMVGGAENHRKPMPIGAEPEFAADLLGEPIEAEGCKESAAGKAKMLSTSSRGKNGQRKTAGGRRLRTGPDEGEEQQYAPPVLANPGNVIERHYTAAEVAELLGCEPSDILSLNVGGGQMGEQSKLASKSNEAPYPEDLPEFFIRSFCPPGEIVLDPFSGSGTTAAVAVRWGRKAIGFDIRQSQVDASLKRIANETPVGLFVE